MEARTDPIYACSMISISCFSYLSSPHLHSIKLVERNETRAELEEEKDDAGIINSFQWTHGLYHRISGEIIKEWCCCCWNPSLDEGRLLRTPGFGVPLSRETSPW